MSTELHEVFFGEQLEGVDEEKGILRGVKLVGLTSQNRGAGKGAREYTPKALKEAIPLYEGAPVNINHIMPGTPSSRRMEDRFGKIARVRFLEGKGLYGDVEYNPHHEQAKKVAWAARHQPDSYGFSHHSAGAVNLKSGREVVESIRSVRSVDLVADPATVKSLYESVDSPGNSPQGASMDFSKLTLKDLQENAPHLLRQHDASREDAETVKTLTESLEKATQELDALKAARVYEMKKAAIIKQLRESKLPSEMITPVFVKQLTECASPEEVATLIEDRKTLVQGLEENRHRSPARSREQTLSEATGRQGSQRGDNTLKLADFVRTVKFGS